jgi:Kelch motif/Galactose oxidase, central domain
MQRARTIAIAAMAALFTASCSSKDEPSEGPPTIGSFTATPQTITRGTGSVLTWECAGAASIWIDPDVGPVNGSTWTVTPSETTTYTLTAGNEHGTASARTTVVVQCGENLICQPENECAIGATVCASPTAIPTCSVRGNKNNGDVCGDGHVCSSGTCVEVCREIESCTPPDVCKIGVTRCATSWASATCSVIGNRPDGAVCGTNQVCSAGSCVAAPAIARVHVSDAVVVVNNAVTLTAIVTVGAGNPSTEVDWLTEGGTVNPSRGRSTTFVAPAVPGKFKVWATSVADPAKRDFAYVIVRRPPDSWRTVSKLPIPRYGAAALALNDRVYVIGGRLDDHTLPTEVDVYDPATRSWSRGPDMPTPRYQPAAAVLNGRIYALGGSSGEEPLNTVEMLDPVTGTWSTRMPLPTPRSSLVAIAASGRIYAIGGYFTGEYPYMSDVVEEYDPVTDTWMSRPPLNGLRASGAGGAWNGLPFVVGGTRWDLGAERVWAYLSSFEQYSPIAYSWSYGPSLPSARSGLAVATSPDGKAYAIGGREEDDYASSDVDEYDPETLTWSSRSHMPNARYDFAAAYAGGAIFAIGGWNSYVTDTVDEYTPPLSAASVTAAVGLKPWGILHDGTNIWVANTGSASVSKIRTRDGAVLGTYPVGSEPRGDMAFDGTYVWVTNTYSHTVSKIRAFDGGNFGTFGVGAYPHGAAFDGANVWVANWSGNSVTKLRASDGSALGTYTVGLHPCGVAFDGSSVWVTTSNEVVRLRPSDGTRIGSFTSVSNPYGITFDGTSIWVANHGSDTVTKIRPSDGAHLGTFVVGSAPLGVAAAGSSVWVTSSGTDTVTELRASDGAVIATLKAGKEPRGVAFDGARPWVTNYGGNDVGRLY